MISRTGRVSSALAILLTVEMCTCLFCPDKSILMPSFHRCLWILNSPLTVNEAVAECHQNQGLVLTVDDGNIQKFIENTLSVALIGLGISSIWINRVGPQDVTFEGESQSYTNWNLQPPDGDDPLPTFYCGIINIGDGETYQWQPVNCYLQTSSLVCYKELDCPENALYLLSYDMCFWVTSAMKTALNGRLDCKDGGGTLADIPNSDVNKVMISSYFDVISTSANTTGGDNDLWIGINDVCEEGVYVTQMGTNAAFFNWRQDQPNNSPGDQDCVIIAVDDHLEWHDRACDERRISLCSKNLTAPTLTTTNLTCPVTTTQTSTVLSITPPTTTTTPTTMTPATTPPTTTTPTVAPATTPPTTTTHMVTPATDSVSITTAHLTSDTSESESMCYCPQFSVTTNITVSVQLKVQKLKTEMLIDANQTSAYRRRLTSASDPRRSAQVIGVTAVAIVMVPVVLVLTPDVIQGCRWIVSKLRPN